VDYRIYNCSFKLKTLIDSLKKKKKKCNYYQTRIAKKFLKTNVSYNHVRDELLKKTQFVYGSSNILLSLKIKTINMKHSL
jgi:hypothetical protein